ncbi:MAG TPA: Nramp family divalent metal transporter [Pseudomonadales bacterium]|nr:Nramp family divalent metal transporter [Pseudomonadales bacterium]
MRLGPGAMVAAAFIGPGTVTTAASAGATSGAALLWAVAFSVLATLVLQELALRSALVTQRDLAGLMRTIGTGRWWGSWLMLLIMLAIGVGNAAYQSGNLSGAGLGLQAAFGLPLSLVIACTALVAGALIYLDSYHVFERVLVSLVALMALLFIGLALLLLPAFIALPSAKLWPSFSSQHLTLMLALIGTTVVPYNLFLHANAVKLRWAGESIATALDEARRESAISILIGGTITAAIVVVAATAIQHSDGTGIIQALVSAVETQLPGWGRILVGSGLFAAGITSSITAPLAAGWAVCGALGDDRQGLSKWIALVVLVTGTLFALLATRPTVLIIGAQATNALLLPIIALTLLHVANSPLLGDYRNRTGTNMLAVTIVVTVTVLALRKIVTLF